MTLSEIALTWPHFQRSSPEVRQLVLERIVKCDGCPNKGQLTDTSIERREENNPGAIYFCTLCGCQLWSKLKDEDNSCPENRWQAVQSYY